MLPIWENQSSHSPYRTLSITKCSSSAASWSFSLVLFCSCRKHWSICEECKDARQGNVVSSLWSGGRGKQSDAVARARSIRSSEQRREDRERGELSLCCLSDIVAMYPSSFSCLSVSSLFGLEECGLWSSPIVRVVWGEGGKESCPCVRPREEGRGGEGREGCRGAHRMRGLCVGLGRGLSGPLAFLCSLALEERRAPGQTHTHTTLMGGTGDNKQLFWFTSHFLCYSSQMTVRWAASYTHTHAHTHPRTRASAHTHTSPPLSLHNYQAKNNSRILAGQTREKPLPQRKWCHSKHAPVPGSKAEGPAPSLCQSCRNTSIIQQYSERERERNRGRARKR